MVSPVSVSFSPITATISPALAESRIFRSSACISNSPGNVFPFVAISVQDPAAGLQCALGKSSERSSRRGHQ